MKVFFYDRGWNLVNKPANRAYFPFGSEPTTEHPLPGDVVTLGEAWGSTQAKEVVERTLSTGLKLSRLKHGDNVLWKVE